MTIKRYLLATRTYPGNGALWQLLMTYRAGAYPVPVGDIMSSVYLSTEQAVLYKLSPYVGFL